jgi:cytochrome P450
MLLLPARRRPRTAAVLARKPDLIDTVMEEALWLESPFRQQMRSIPRDTLLGGVDIPSGSTAVLLFSSASRDPAQFDNPDVVDLARSSPRRHLASTTASAPRSSASKRGPC